MTTPSAPAAPLDPHAGEDPLRPLEALIIGAGFGGLGMGLRLIQAGVRDFIVVEAEAGVGGTWRVNTYPGAACDVPSSLYSFSFAQKPDWTHTYARQDEIRLYLEDLATRGGLRPHLRLSTRALACAWDEQRALWAVDTDDGRRRWARALVAAAGGLSQPAMPQIDGLDAFGGPCFHTARWDHEVDLRGKRVGVIGTGASAIQVVPAIVDQVAELSLYQRTPPWILRRRDGPRSALLNRLRAAVPALMHAERQARWAAAELRVIGFVHEPRLMRVAQRFAEAHLRDSVPDPALRARLRPPFTFGCKRVLLSNDWYPALQRPNLRLIDRKVLRVERGAVVSAGADGAEERRPLDVLICATGFVAANAVPRFRVEGRGGQTLAAAWARGPEAWHGTLVHGFPNLFLVVGPNTGLGHSSMVLMIEAQLQLILDALRHLQRHRWIEVKAEAQKAENDELQRRLSTTVWAGGCGAWYIAADGRNTTLWPGSTARFARQLRALDTAAVTMG
ncbi:MAG: hypothetical protein RL071_2824 [Pseudomonadota bacterium]